MTPRLDAAKPGCGDAGQPAALAHPAADGDALGGARPPWRRLLKAGRSGCDAVAGWLGAGAAGVGDPVAEKALIALIDRADAPLLERLWPLFGARSDRLDAALLTALASRLPALDDAQAAAVAGHPSAAVRRAALPLLIGHHSVGRWETVSGRPVWRESSLRVAPTGPSPEHLDAVVAVLQQARGRGETAARFAELAGRLLEEGAPGAAAWVPLLLPMVELSGRADQDTANAAARAIAWGGGDAAAPLDRLVAERRMEALSHYLDGLAARLRAKDDLDATLAALARVAAADLGAPSSRARQMHAAWSRRRG